MEIDSIFLPDGIECFLGQALGRNALFVRGQFHKFRPLASWSMINSLLTFGNVTHPRVRVILGDEEIPLDNYSRIGNNGYPRLLVAELTNFLREGALVAIDAVDQLEELIAEFCSALESRLGLPVEGELYASCAAHPGRRPQWNDHETLLFQIEGCKTWTLHQPTARCPIKSADVPMPKGPPRWRGDVQQGDLLYIPRGWWYQDGSSAQPMLYLAVTFTIPRGADVVWRLFDGLASKDVMRMDIPRFLGADHQSRFLTGLQQELSEAITTAGSFKGLLADIQECSDPIVRFGLPWSALPRPLPPSSEFRLVPLTRFAELDTVCRRRDRNFVYLRHNGQMLAFDEQITCVLGRLCRLPNPTLGELLVDCAHLGEDRVLSYISDLVKNGLLYASPPRVDRPDERSLVPDGEHQSKELGGWE